MVLPDNFTASIQSQIERLRSESLQEIESHVAEKRIAWVQANYPAGSGLPQPVSPRRAFEILFFEYMGLTPLDLPVISESDDEIVWASKNPCPTLEACRELGLDTRVVCRGAYEQSTQAFLSALDSHLRFIRSYTEIRPHAPHCLERIRRKTRDQ